MIKLFQKGDYDASEAHKLGVECELCRDYEGQRIEFRSLIK